MPGEVKRIHDVTCGNLLDEVEVGVVPSRSTGHCECAGIQGRKNILKARVRPQLVVGAVIVAIREAAREGRQQNGRTSRRKPVAKRVIEFVSIAEFSAYLDSCHVGAQVVVPCRCSRSLQIQLSAEPVVGLNVVQSEIRTCISFRKAGWRPLRKIKMSGACRIILAGTRRQIGRIKTSVLVADLADLPGT